LIFTVGAAEGCDRLIFIRGEQNQQIAAFGSSYMGWVFIVGKLLAALNAAAI
jgi:hypothetical protein